MPTKYSELNELMILEQFRKKIEREEGGAILEKSESPDGIIKTKTGRVFGVEVTAALRTRDLAIFLNKSHEDSSITSFSDHWKGDAQVQTLCEKILERVQEKDGKETYSHFESAFNQSVLIIYLDDPLLNADDVERIGRQDYSVFLLRFNAVYLYVRSTYNSSPEGVKHTEGFFLVGTKKNA